jgi:hypothetical protein
MEHYTDIFQYITSQETAFKQGIEVNTKRWSMKDHLTRSALYRDSDIVGEKDKFTPIKNITRPILNLQYRTEDIDVKDVQIYVDDKDKFHLSFLVKKYHDDVFTQEYDLDSYFDALNQSRIDFGGGLSKSVKSPCPEVVPLQSIAFCDQTDILSGPIGIKHYYSPDQLLAMASRGWGKKGNGATASLEDLIALSRDQKNQNKEEGITETPGRYIEVYEVHGNLPKQFADSTYQGEEYETRIFIVAFYQKQDSMEKYGITLFTALEPESPFKIVLRDPVFGRGLGFGGAEELFEAQLWTNYAMIRMQDMLDSASKTIILSEDPAFTQRNKVRSMENLEVADVERGAKVAPMDTYPRNYSLFNEATQQWEEHAQKMGAATDPLQGEQSTAGTPFAAIQAQIQQGMGLHDYRRGIFAKHLEEVYRDWIIPHIEKKICEGTTFLSELSMDELQFVTDSLLSVEIERAKKEYVLSNAGQAMPPELEQLYAQQVMDAFKKKGNKHFIEILKGEFKGTKLGVKVSIAGKSKNLGKATDAVVNILKFAFSNPQGFALTMQIPGMSASFNQIIEYAGLSPVDFSGISKIAQQQMAQPQQAPQEMQPQGQPQIQ